MQKQSDLQYKDIFTGINPLLWQQAILDNPDPERLIPVPMIGFKELHTRLKCQEQQTKLHQQRLDVSKPLVESLAPPDLFNATSVFDFYNFYMFENNEEILLLQWLLFHKFWWFSFPEIKQSPDPI